MSDLTQFFLYSLMYRLAILTSGTLFAYMGYRLFLRGVFDQSGDLEAAWREKHVLLKKAVPGTFFAFFGVTMIITSLVKGPVVPMSGDAIPIMDPMPEPEPEPAAAAIFEPVSFTGHSHSKQIGTGLPITPFNQPGGSPTKLGHYPTLR